MPVVHHEPRLARASGHERPENAVHPRRHRAVHLPQVLRCQAAGQLPRVPGRVGGAQRVAPAVKTGWVTRPGNRYPAPGGADHPAQGPQRLPLLHRSARDHKRGHDRRRNGVGPVGGRGHQSRHRGFLHLGARGRSHSPRGPPNSFRRWLRRVSRHRRRHRHPVDSFRCSWASCAPCRRHPCRRHPPRRRCRRRRRRPGSWGRHGACGAWPPAPRRRP